jgi:putative aldouronate transport system permease protein
MHYKKSVGEKSFDVINIALFGFLAILWTYPFIYTLSMSLSTAAEASRDGFHFFPRDISFFSYKAVLGNPNILTGYYNTIMRTFLGTVLTLLASCIAAYPLSRREMPKRSMIIFFIVFTMLFSGGMIPNYILVKDLGMINTMWSLVIPTLLSGFNIIIMKNFFQSIPESFVEAARIEGAGEWTILFKIFIPLSKPVLATVALWTMVAHWNAWLDALLYITDDNKQVLQIFLQRIVIESSAKLMDMGVTDQTITQFTPETIKAATVIVTILPIICVYPFVQKYFVSGIMLGGVKE